jgi:hypothetical protein
MSFPNDDNLLNLLVEKTFEKNENPQEMVSYLVTYHRNIKCYQVEIAEKLYTFPSNWGPFKLVDKREGEGVILENDLEHFNSIFGSLVGEEVKTAFIYRGHETYLVFVPANMEANLADLHSLINDESDFKISA